MDEEELRKIFAKESRFMGVYAANEIIDLKLLNDRGFIVNTSVRRIPYGHWIAVYRDREGYMYFIDSLCIKSLMYDPHFKMFFKNNHVKYVKTLCNSIQSSTSRTCGAFTIYFLSNLFKYKSFASIIENFNIKNKFFNDILVTSYVLKMIK